MWGSFRDVQRYVSWYGLSSFLFHLFSPSLPCPLFPFISDPVQLCLLVLCLLPCQLQGILTQPCYCQGTVHRLGAGGMGYGLGVPERADSLAVGAPPREELSGSVCSG